eukprot:m.24258 g.24258  ORF g.24258 m.24258 type:complete len:77 (+) comp6051_c0_seq1:1621-1851(+)
MELFVASSCSIIFHYHMAGNNRPAGRRPSGVPTVTSLPLHHLAVPERDVDQSRLEQLLLSVRKKIYQPRLSGDQGL